MNKEGGGMSAARRAAVGGKVDAGCIMTATEEDGPSAGRSVALGVGYLDTASGGDA